MTRFDSTLDSKSNVSRFDSSSKETYIFNFRHNEKVDQDIEFKKVFQQRLAYFFNFYYTLLLQEYFSNLKKTKQKTFLNSFLRKGIGHHHRVHSQRDDR